MTERDTENRLTPTCPHCGYSMNDDDMSGNRYTNGDDGDDLWALAPQEGRTKVVCPDILCKKPYFVQGGYTPRYTSAIDEDEL